MTEQEERRIIESLWAEAPGFACVPGCTDCCGPVFHSRWEWSQVADQREPVGLECPYASAAKGCAIHPQRPLICRLYGVVDAPGWRCPHGRGPERLIPWPEARAMLDRYHRILDAQEAEGDTPRGVANGRDDVAATSGG